MPTGFEAGEAPVYTDDGAAAAMAAAAPAGLDAASAYAAPVYDQSAARMAGAPVQQYTPYAQVPAYAPGTEWGQAATY